MNIIFIVRCSFIAIVLDMNVCVVLCMAKKSEGNTVAVSYVGVGTGGGEQSPPVSLQNEGNATPAASNTPGGDPGLTVLQSPVSQSQVSSAIPPYSTMLPSFGHYATGGFFFFISYSHFNYSWSPTNSRKTIIRFNKINRVNRIFFTFSSHTPNM